jgi:hypothetical protein
VCREVVIFQEIVKKGAKEILSYLHDLQAGSENVYRTKLMVVGQGGGIFMLPLIGYQKMWEKPL